jgi:hypothetical protein
MSETRLLQLRHGNWQRSHLTFIFIVAQWVQWQDHELDGRYSVSGRDTDLLPCTQCHYRLWCTHSLLSIGHWQIMPGGNTTTAWSLPDTPLRSGVELYLYSSAWCSIRPDIILTFHYYLIRWCKMNRKNFNVWYSCLSWHSLSPVFFFRNLYYYKLDPDNFFLYFGSYLTLNKLQ